MRTLPALAVAALVAGCFGAPEAPNEQTFRATGGVVSAGWSYDGSAVVGREATLDGSTDDAANTGAADVTFVIDEESWVVRFDRFAQGEGRDFQDGGIEHGLDEHGDTGVADASIPRIHALVAAWGSATVARGGAVVTTEPWTAHLMVSRDTVRGPDGKITKADGATPYDPAAPGDARRIENDPQAILFIKHPMGEDFSRGAVASTLSLSCVEPQCTQTGEIPLDAGARGFMVNISTSPGGPVPLGAGRGVTVVIADAAGAEIGRYDLGDVVAGPVPGPTASDEVDLRATPVTGPLTVTVTGDGSFSVTLEATVTYDDRPFLVVTWDEVTVS